MLWSGRGRRVARNWGNRSRVPRSTWRSRSAYRSSTWILQRMRSPKKAMLGPIPGPRSRSSAVGRGPMASRNLASAGLRTTSEVSDAGQLILGRGHGQGRFPVELGGSHRPRHRAGALLPLHVDAAAEVRAIGDGDAGSHHVAFHRAVLPDVDLLGGGEVAG